MRGGSKELPDQRGANTTDDVAHPIRLPMDRPSVPTAALCGSSHHHPQAPSRDATTPTMQHRPPQRQEGHVKPRVARASNRDQSTRTPAQRNKHEREHTGCPHTMILGKRPDELVLAIEHARVWSIPCLRCRHDDRDAATATKRVGGVDSEGCSRRRQPAKQLVGGTPRFNPAGGGPPAGRARPGQRDDEATVSMGRRTRWRGKAGEPC